MERPWLKHYESEVRPHLEYPDVPLPFFLDRSAENYADRTALIFGAVAHDLPGQPLLDGKLTYRALNYAANRFGNALVKLGVKKGDRVALYLPNCPQYIIAFYGALRAGAVIAPINPIYTPRELEFNLKDSGAETIVAFSQFYPKVQQVRGQTRLKNVIVTNVKEYFPTFLKTLFTLAKEKKEGHRVTLASGDYWFQDLLNSASLKAPGIPASSADDAVLLYTGGTTGIPKAAQLTHANLIANTIQLREWLTGAKEGQEVFLTALPLFHSYAMTTCMNLGINMAGTMILIPNPRDLEHIFKSIDTHKPTLYPGVPTMYVAINNYKDLARYNVTSLRACISGAAGLPSEVQKRFQDITGGRLVEGYGLSESSPVLCANPINGDNRIGTVGLPLSDTDVKVVDIETGETEMPVGESGELIARGPQVMRCYWNKPAETAHTVRLHDGDLWLHTGDVAVMDQDGYFKIVDRKKEMIITGGFNVYPREVEDVLFQHPAVLEAAVIGVADAHSGERVKAFVVLKPGAAATSEDLIEFSRQHLAPYKVPKYVEFREALPKTLIGKVLRRELAAEEKTRAQTSPPA